MDSLYAVENAVTVFCRSCCQPIDIWNDHGLIVTLAGVTRRKSLTEALCLECLVRTYPTEEREKLAGAYEHQRSAAREAGIPPSVTAYVLSTEGNPGDWSDGYLAISYAVQIRGWDDSSEIRPHITVIPDDPSECQFSLVFFAARMMHYDVKFAYRKFIWPFQDLSAPARCEVVNEFDSGVPEAGLSDLVRGRRFFFQQGARSGRRTGTGKYAPGEESDFVKDVDRVLTMRERDGLRITTSQMLADALGMGKTALYDMFKRAPKAKERYRRHRRAPIRSV